MQTVVRLYSVMPNEIGRFLSKFYKNSNIMSSSNVNSKTNSYSMVLTKNTNRIVSKQWQKEYANPVEMVDIIGAYVENIDEYNLTMWISLDSGVFIKVTEDNADELIRYLYERYPY